MATTCGVRKGDAIGRGYRGLFEDCGNVLLLKLSNKEHRYLSYYLKQRFILYRLFHIYIS